MRRVLAWTLKEWRDHRTVVIGIAIAMPLLMTLAFWGFGRQIRGATPSSVAPIVAGVLLGLVWFAIAGDLVSQESRRGTTSLMRRLPGGLATAWAGKLVFLATALYGLAVWTCVALALLWSATASSSVESASASTLWAWVFAPSKTMLFTVVGVGLLAWVMLVGTWIGRSGAAGLGALVLLGVVVAPVVMWAKAEPWVFGLSDAMWLLVAIVLSLFVLLVATVSWLVGHRHAARAWRPVVIGASLLVLVLGGGAAWAAYDNHQWQQYDLDDSQLGIYQVFMSPDEETLYVSTYKGVLWMGGKPIRGQQYNLSTLTMSTRGTPLSTWRYHVPTRQGMQLGSGTEQWFYEPYRCALGMMGVGKNLEPLGVLCAQRLDETVTRSRRGQRAWIDTRSHEIVATLATDVRTPLVDRLLRDALREITPIRDAEGRRAWIREGVFEREGDPLGIASTRLVPNNYADVPAFEAIPGGWINQKRTMPGSKGYVLDGNGMRHPFQERTPYRFFPTRMLSLEHVLESRRVGKRDDRKIEVMLGSVASDETRPAQGAKPLPSCYAIVAKDAVVVPGRPGENTVFALWDPVTGERRPLQLEGTLPIEVTELRTLGRRSDGRVLVLALESYGAPRSTLITIDPAACTGHVLGTVNFGVFGATALLKDGSAVVVERGERVVRLGPRQGQHQVLLGRDE